MGEIQWTPLVPVQPNQNIEMGRKMEPTMAMGSRASGMKSSNNPLVELGNQEEGNTYVRDHWRTWA